MLYKRIQLLGIGAVVQSSMGLLVSGVCLLSAVNKRMLISDDVAAQPTPISLLHMHLVLIQLKHGCATFQRNNMILLSKYYHTVQNLFFKENLDSVLTKI